jgi:hypothetical protein
MAEMTKLSEAQQAPKDDPAPTPQATKTKRVNSVFSLSDL